MKLLLVSPNFKGVVLVPSLGLGFIGTYIKENSECKVEIVESILQGLSQAQVIEKASKSDIIGLSCYSETRFECFNLAKQIKTVNSKCKIVVGGPHVSTLDRKILRHYPFIDAVVRMEGEETVLDIVRGNPFDKIPGITWRREDDIVRNPDRSMYRDINQYGYDYSLSFPTLKGWKDLEIPNKLQKLNAIPIIASRGCPYRCAFCAAHRQWRGSYRGLSPDELVSRMKDLVDRYDIGYFRFYDALFIGSEKRILEFCDKLEESRLEVHFRIDIRVGTSENVLKRLRAVGCDVVGFGVESGCDRILKRMNKGIVREQIETTIRLCKKLGFWIIGFFMISLPDETIEDVKTTFDLFRYFDRINVQFFKLHPNTTSYDELVMRDEINDEIWFDPDEGDQTEYGNELYYCKENFPSAIFSMDEGNFLVESSTYKYHIVNPRSALHGKSFHSRLLTFSFSYVMDLLLQWKQLRKFYIKFKKTSAFRLLKLVYRHIR